MPTQNVNVPKGFDHVLKLAKHLANAQRNHSLFAKVLDSQLIRNMTDFSTFESAFDLEDFRDGCGVGLLANRTGLATRSVLTQSFTALKNLAHRGAVDADGKTGDGAGILTRLPKGFYRKKALEVGVTTLTDVDFAVGFFFYPQKLQERLDCEKIVADIFQKYHLEILWKRLVPVDLAVLGKKARSLCPHLVQKFILKPAYLREDDFERILFLIRKELDYFTTEESLFDFYTTSLSCKTIIHKGLFVGDEVRSFYVDLQDEDFISPYVVFHQRYSTNTFPSWSLAQPFRMLAHNGEINTIQANRKWMRAREIAGEAKSWVPEQHSMNRIIIAGRSDSASLDNVLEVYVHGGRSILHALVHMIPEAWQRQNDLSPELKAFYEYHACLAEPFDGPAALAFCDDRMIGAILDRNGLRPARYKITKDVFFVCSEMGCVDFAPEDVEENGKLSPGKIIALDLNTGKILKNSDIKDFISKRKPYAAWVAEHLITLESVLQAQNKNHWQTQTTLASERLRCFEEQFAYTLEDDSRILTPMLTDGKEPHGSMGDDIPLANFSKKPHTLYAHFKQMFAQVTNPAIDPIREFANMSLRLYLGEVGNMFREEAHFAKRVRLRSPILTQNLFLALQGVSHLACRTLSVCFTVSDGVPLEDVLQKICCEAEKHVDAGCQLLVLTDENIDSQNAPVPMLLAISAVHQHLIAKGKRLRVSLVAKTAEAREVHHMACLVAYGASAVYPYLAECKVLRLAEKSGIATETALKNYVQSLDTGLLKIMAKMGISTLQSYHGSELFEVVGLNTNFVKKYFGNTPSRLSGLNTADLLIDIVAKHHRAFGEPLVDLADAGFYRFRKQGERHAFAPDVIKALHKAVKEGDAKSFAQYQELVNEREPMVFRDLLTFQKAKSSLSLAQVEPASEIVKRFCTPGISFGAISKEVHEDFAIAMNRLGGKSDSGEGGEDPARYVLMSNGDSKNSAIKQIASGRFGVTAEYIANAVELEIKIAQGAKPGEGGQLPGHKVSVEIAKVRHATSGVTLISPPPHHDIYSIEDLAQLIFDLREANPIAKIFVKLVSEAGVGTIAAGVVKAGADGILISGHDGGTGAAPLSSIRHAGLPWELGLSEAHQMLLHNQLRQSVMLRVDGGLKTGLDVIKAALLGAEEFGFGTAALVSAGCVMVRQCHLNTCPVGIATQDPILRAKYQGTPEQIMRFFLFVAEEVRLILAALGVPRFQDVIGRTDWLEIKPQAKDYALHLHTLRAPVVPLLNKEPLPQKLSGQLVSQLLPEVVAFLEKPLGEFVRQAQINNRDRAVGARFSFERVKRYADHALPNAANLKFQFYGTAGQSFGAFLAKNLELHLTGEANDYVGKGLSGGLVSLKPFETVRYQAHENILCGNTCLYGATSGQLYVNGRAGERFAVRNSGAEAVVEGLGDHGCEYMTGGRVVVLGAVGRNFAAGFTGGEIWVYDPKDSLIRSVNTHDAAIAASPATDAAMALLLATLKQHVLYTESAVAEKILNNWQCEKVFFKQVVPHAFSTF